MPERVRVALVGAGRIGRLHARVLATEVPGATLVGVADAVEGAARRVADELGVNRWTADAPALIADPGTDAVVIASSTDTHRDFIEAAAAAGKDVFCEKPIALDLDATDRALAAVEAAGVRLQIGFQRRFDEGYRRAKELIAAGDLGTIEAIHDSLRDPQPPPRAYVATSGGLYRDMTIHCFDSVRWLMGDEVAEVYALATTAVDPMFAELDDVDTSIVTLRFANGGIASIENSRRSGFGYDVRTEIFGSKGALFVGDGRATPLLHLSAAGVRGDHVADFLGRFGDAYAAELRAFVGSILAGTPPPVDGADGRAAMALAYAADRSRRENRPVRVDEFAP
jgi:myo-inositol 2-dehydrogenase / D-chiro-inositol 1-dehydrogenase